MLKYLLAAFSAFSLLMTACTRELPKTANVSVVLPSSLHSSKVSTQANLTLNHLVVNVTGPGISSPVFFSWDSNQGRINPPAAFTIDVPGGDGRLIQVLAIYEELGIASEQFYYGDATASIVDAETNVSIIVSKINSSTGEGQIAGRYVTSANSGPTGPISMFYKPADKPKMLVHVSEMFGGFFRVFALQGAQFEYVLGDGTNMFGGPVDVNAVSLSNAMKVYMPPLWRERYDENTMTYEEQPQTNVVVGWFGPSAAGKGVCYPSAAEDISQAYLDDLGTTQLVWDSSVVSGATAAYDLAGGTATGDIDSTTELCNGASGSRFVDYLSLNAAGLAEHDAAIATNGPYYTKPDSSGYRQTLSATLSAGQLTLGWEYLPGVYSNSSPKGIDGSDVFFKIYPVGASIDEEEVRADDGYACGNLPAGFNNLRSQPVASPGVYVENFVLTTLPANFATAWDEGRVMLVLCPYTGAGSSKVYYKSGASYMNYGGGGGPMMATSVQAVFPNGSTTASAFVNNLCVPVDFKGMNGAYTAQLPSGTTITLSSTGLTSTNWYTMNDCTSPVGFPYNFNGSQVARFYLKRTGGGVNSGTITATLNNSFPNINLSVNFYDAPAIGSMNEQLRYLGPTAINAHRCYPISFFSFHNDGANSAVVDFTTSYIFSSASITGLEIHNTSDCSSTFQTAFNFTLASWQTHNEMWLKYTGPSSTLNFNIAGDGAFVSAGGVYSVPALSVTQPGPLHHLSIMGPPDAEEGGCSRLEVELQDANNNPKPVGVTSINLTSSAGGQFYDGNDMSCNGVANNVLNFAVNEFRKVFHYKNTTAFGATATITANLTSPVMTESMNMALTEPTVRHLLVVMPGQTYNNTLTLVGAPSNLTQFTPYTIYLKAVKYNGQLVTNFNGPLLTTLSVTSGVTSAPGMGSVNFTNGEASFMITPDTGVYVDIYAHVMGANMMPIMGNGSAPSP
jgi:hypothetical protein